MWVIEHIPVPLNRRREGIVTGPAASPMLDSMAGVPAGTARPAALRSEACPPAARLQCLIDEWTGNWIEDDRMVFPRVWPAVGCTFAAARTFYSGALPDALECA